MSDRNLKTHYSAAELAELNLPNIPTTKANVILFAERMEWPSIEVRGRGGIRREYVPPAEIVEAIRVKAAQELVATTPAKRLALRPEDQLPLIETENQSLKADARKGVLLALETLMNRSGYPLKKAARTLVSMARTGEANPQLIAMLKMARDERGRPSADGLPSERSLLRFVEYERSGQLAPKRRERDMSIPAWAPAFLAIYQRPEKPTVEHAYRQFLTLPESELPPPPPSVWQVRRFLSKVGNVTLQTGRMGDRELKSLKPFIRRNFDHMLPTDVYSADGHTFDTEVQHPIHGRPFRPEVTSIVDIATRRVVGWSLDLSESAYAVIDALRCAVLNGGIPATFYVDNGSGYRNHLMSDLATGLMSRLGIEMTHSIAYNSQARGVIERLHKTLWVSAAKELPGYIGHDMDREAKHNVFKLSRKALKSKPGEVTVMPLIGWEGFVEFCEQKVDTYNNRPHRSLQKITDPATGRRRHMTPNEAWALAVTNGFEPHKVTDDEARPLFRPQVLRTIQRCEISLFGNRYFAKELVEFHRDQLRIGYDIHDAEKVWVYDADGRFICTAELNGNQRDYIAKSADQRAKEKRAMGREKLILNKLTEVREELYGMPALDMMENVSIPGFMNISREQLNARSREAIPVEVVEQAPAAVEVVQMPVSPISTEWRVPEMPQDRWAEWQKLNSMREEEIGCEKQKKWRQTYQATAEFRTYQRKSA